MLTDDWFVALNLPIKDVFILPFLGGPSTKYFFSSPYKAEQKSLVLAQQAQRTNQGRTLSFVLLESSFAQFQQSAGDTRLLCLWIQVQPFFIC
jgi:hypothetical protein